MVGGMITHQINQRRGSPSRIMEISDAITQSRPQVEHGDRRLLSNTRVAIGSARTDPLKQT